MENASCFLLPAPAPGLLLPPAPNLAVTTWRRRVSRLGMRTLRLTSLCAAFLLIGGFSVHAQTGKGIHTEAAAPTATIHQPAANSTGTTESVTPASVVTTPQALSASAASLSQTATATKTALPQAGSNQTAAAPRSLSASPTKSSGLGVTTASKTSASALIAAASRTKESHEVVVKTQESEIATAAAKLDELRQLVADGLIARVELENAEHLVTGLRNNLETLKKNVADSERTIGELRKAEELAKVKPLIPATTNTSTRSFLKPTILRYGGEAGWSLGRLGMVQTFFASTFGQMLPVSALGQSATHNRLGYNHRNAVDVALHPDSVQGKALISYLESQGIPYLAFRSAVAGVATGPHIHIGYPSNRT